MTYLRHGVTCVLAAVLLAGVSADAHPPEREGAEEGRRDAESRKHHGKRGMMFEIFRAADRDQDRSVTLAEVQAIEDEMFAWLDRDSDGVIGEPDRPPIPAMVGARHRADAVRGGEDSGAPHRLMDANEDGQISREEFGVRAVERFNRLDADGDGVVTPEEFDQAVAERQGRRFWWREQ